ncbi:MAG TPA: AIR synthase related protein [Streptosporangiaceae bacterium]|nr:AIR synthase related protein [Streptosporangiaceae bacterium]
MRHVPRGNGNVPNYLTEIGEYGIHGILESILNTGTERTIGDDCAVYKISEEDVLLINVDRLASNVEPYNRARLCVAQTLSDIICMGGTPESFLVALTLARDSTLQMLEELTVKLQSELKSYGAQLIGGDTKEGRAFHMVGVALGRARAQSLVRRVGALPGMVIGVTSTNGRSWGARWANAVIRELRIDVSDELTTLCHRADHIIRLPLLESQAIIASGCVRAGLDLSDGIGGALRILNRVSNVHFNIERNALAALVDSSLEPVAHGLGLPLECLALSPGYNWENMYVIEGEAAGATTTAAESVGGRFTIIGSVSEGAGVSIDGQTINVDRLPADEKFAKEYEWEDRFNTWWNDCREILLKD